MKKRLVLLFMAAVMAFTMTACRKRAKEEDMDFETEEETAFSTPYGPYSEGAEWGNNYEGSAVYIDGTTAIVTIAVTDTDTPFEESDIALMKENTKKALDYITKTVKEYGKEANFIFGESDLDYKTEYEIEDISDFEAEDYDTFLEEYINENIDTAKIRETYNADGIAYMVYLNGEGEAFASPHWQEDEEYFQCEGAYFFTRCYDEYMEECITGPDIYMAQLLQLFGGVPLSYPDATYGLTASLFEDVMYYYNNDVLYSVYDDDGALDEKEITKEITDITAYTLGITDTFDELSDNPSFTKKYRACITDDYMDNTNGGEDESLYEIDEDFGGELYDADGDGVGDYAIQWEEVEDDGEFDADDEGFEIEEDLGELPSEEAVVN